MRQRWEREACMWLWLLCQVLLAWLNLRCSSWFMFVCSSESISLCLCAPATLHTSYRVFNEEENSLLSNPNSLQSQGWRETEGEREKRLSSHNNYSDTPPLSPLVKTLQLCASHSKRFDISEARKWRQKKVACSINRANVRVERELQEHWGIYSPFLRQSASLSAALRVFLSHTYCLYLFALLL